MDFLAAVGRLRAYKLRLAIPKKDVALHVWQTARRKTLHPKSGGFTDQDTWCLTGVFLEPAYRAVFCFQRVQLFNGARSMLLSSIKSVRL